MPYVESFRAFNAELLNPQWAYSAKAADGSIVMSCWSHRLKLQNGVLRYEDYLSRWNVNAPGKNLLICHLQDGLDNQVPVRLVVATAEDPTVIDRGETATGMKNTFHPKPEVVGKVVLFDGENFAIEFRKT
jgi:hypothetical protein